MRPQHILDYRSRSLGVPRRLAVRHPIPARLRHLRHPKRGYGRYLAGDEIQELQEAVTQAMKPQRSRFHWWRRVLCR